MIARLLRRCMTLVTSAFAEAPSPFAPAGESAERISNDGDPPSDQELAIRRFLLYFFMPLWIVPGLADWYWHRRTQIERNAGTHEALTHVLMMSSIGLPVTAALLFDVNALVLASMIAGVVVHEGVSFWDVSYARNRREILAIEQHTHSFLEMLPFLGTSMAICLKPKQFAAIFGRGNEPARWTLEVKKPALSARYVVSVLSAVTLFIALPYGEEFVRCWRADHTLAPHEEDGLD